VTASMRVVIDPNLLVSYLLTHRDPIARIIDTHLAHEDFTLLICVQLLEELEHVLQYHKFRQYFTGETEMRFVALIASVSELVDVPDEVPHIVRDPKDDYLIACALAGAADFIVSGDKDFLDLKKAGNIRVIPARYFSEEILGSNTDDCASALHPQAKEGLRLFNEGKYFEAHEALEAVWRAETGRIRELYQGILQAAVVYHHILRGNYAGAVKVYGSCMKWLNAWPESCRGVNVGQLRADLEQVIAEVQRLGPEHIAEFDRSRLKPVVWDKK
jgi:putative PIN family toxin of toxin-antitoxin system